MAKIKPVSPVVNTPAPKPAKGPIFCDQIDPALVRPDDTVQYMSDWGGSRLGVVVKPKRKNPTGFVSIIANGKKGVDQVARHNISKAWRDNFKEKEEL